MVLACFLFVLVGMLFLVIEATTASASVPGDLMCSDLSECKTDAHCGGPGTPTGCVIACDNGSNITCPRK